MIDDFSDKIIAMIEDKENILVEIEKALFTKRYKLSQKHLGIFSVHSIAMIYAIWEGFIQQSFRAYIDEINSLGIDFERFINDVKVFHLENSFKQFKQYPEKTGKKVEFYKKIGNFYAQSVHNIYNNINTDSNVSFEMLNIILETFGLLPFPERWSNDTIGNRYSYPNPHLKDMLKTFLRYRNGVAHGGDISSEENVTQDVYVKYRVLIEDLMYGIHDKMIQGLKDKTYLKT